MTDPMGSRCPQTSLLAVRDELARVFDGVSIRGEGRAAFVYVELADKAVEISEDENGQWWLEFWEGNEHEAAEETTVPEASAAVQQAIRWLRRSGLERT